MHSSMASLSCFMMDAPSGVIIRYTWRRFLELCCLRTRFFSSRSLISFVSCCLVMPSCRAISDMVGACLPGWFNCIRTWKAAEFARIWFCWW